MRLRAARTLPLANALVFSIAVLLGSVIAGNAAARTSDRNKPMNVDAGHQEGTLDGKSVNVLSGGVTITQGTLDIRSDRADIHQNDGEISRAVLTGKPATLKQQMDDGTTMTARASTIDYDMQTETVTFTGDVKIDQPRGSMSGQRVVYNMNSGKVTSGGEGSRVKMTIQPKNKQGAAAGDKDKPADKPAAKDGD